MIGRLRRQNDGDQELIRRAEDELAARICGWRLAAVRRAGGSRGPSLGAATPARSLRRDSPAGCLLRGMRGRRARTSRLVEPAKLRDALRPPRAAALRRAGPARDHVDAVHRAGRHAEFAAAAVHRNDRVHALARPDDGVGRAGVEATRTADAGRLIDPCDVRRRFMAARRVERLRRPAEQHREIVDQLRTARRAAIEPGFPAASASA